MIYFCDREAGNGSHAWLHGASICNSCWPHRQSFDTSFGSIQQKYHSHTLLFLRILSPYLCFSLYGAVAQKQHTMLSNRKCIILAFLFANFSIMKTEYGTSIAIKVLFVQMTIVLSHTFSFSWLIFPRFMHDIQGVKRMLHEMEII